MRCRRAEAAVALPAQSLGTQRTDSLIVEALILTIADLAVRCTRTGLLDRLLGAPARRPVVEAITLDLRPGETVGLVGELGSGKSTILKAVAGLIAPAAAVLRLGGALLRPRVADRPVDALHVVQLVFQNPDESLNPRHSIATILAQPLELYLACPARRCAAALLAQVRLGEHYLDRLPAQLSGGERQHVAIACAFAADPDIVLCDEVTSALDVSVQAAIVALLDELRRERRAACLFVSHDLGVVRALSDRVVVLYQGRICEEGPAEALYGAPANRYAEALLGAVLEPDPDHSPRLLGVEIVNSGPPVDGCVFQNRCHRRLGAICQSEPPPVRVAGPGHIVRCHLPFP